MARAAVGNRRSVAAGGVGRELRGCEFGVAPGRGGRSVGGMCLRLLLAFLALPLAWGALVAEEAWVIAPVRDGWTSSYYSWDAAVPAGRGAGIADGRLRVGGWGDEYRSLLKFDLTGQPPVAAQVRLRLWCFSSGDTRARGGTPMRLEAVTGPWGSVRKLWWEEQPAGFGVGRVWPAARPGMWYEIEVTALYNAWQSGALANHGLRLSPLLTDNRFNEFRSADYQADPEKRPHLMVLVEAEGETPRTLVRAWRKEAAEARGCVLVRGRVLQFVGEEAAVPVRMRRWRRPTVVWKNFVRRRRRAVRWIARRGQSPGYVGLEREGSRNGGWETAAPGGGGAAPV